MCVCYITKRAVASQQVGPDHLCLSRPTGIVVSPRSTRCGLSRSNLHACCVLVVQGSYCVSTVTLLPRACVVSFPRRLLPRCCLTPVLHLWRGFVRAWRDCCRADVSPVFCFSPLVPDSFTIGEKRDLVFLLAAFSCTPSCIPRCATLRIPSPPSFKRSLRFDSRRLSTCSLKL